MEIPEVRRRLRAVIEQAKRGAAARRERTVAATREYEAFLEERATPTFHSFAAALVAEGTRFKVFTPAGSVRLGSESGADDFIEIVLDSTLDPPRPVGHTSRSRGRRTLVTERPIRPATATADLTADDVLEFLLEEVTPFVER